MNSILIRWKCIGACTALLVAGCSTNPIDRHDQYEFALLAAHTEVDLDVLDRREEASKTFRAVEQYPAVYKYGDEQFTPRRIYVVASHFAAAFPRAPAETRLVIDNLEIKNYVPRPFGNSLGGDSGIDGLNALIYFALRSPEENRLVVRLTGSFGKTSFDVTQHVRYDLPRSDDFSGAVRSAMLTAITKAIEQVRKQGFF